MANGRIIVDPYDGQIMGGNDTLNLINYMSHTWSRLNFAHDAVFVGFYPLLGNYTTWGVVIGDTPCAAVHLMRTDPDWSWGDDPRDTPENTAEKPWLMMFYGNDNSSCFLRFKERKEAIEWLGSHQGVDINSEEMICYNS